MGFRVKWWELDLKKKIGCGKSCQSVWHVINNQLTRSIVMTISNFFFFFFANVLCAEGCAKHCVLRHLFCPWPQSTGQALLSPFQRWEKRGTGRRGEGWQNLQGLDSRFLKGFHHTHPAGLRPRIMDFIFLPVVNLFVPCEFFSRYNYFLIFSYLKRFSDFLLSCYSPLKVCPLVQMPGRGRDQIVKSCGMAGSLTVQSAQPV